MRRRDPDLLKLLSFEYDECAICGVMEPLHLHHVLLRSHGGDDVRANIVCLCRGDHEKYHLGEKEVRRKLVEYVTEKRPDTVAYLREALGVGGFSVWLERHGVA